MADGMKLVTQSIAPKSVSGRNNLFFEMADCHVPMVVLTFRGHRNPFPRLTACQEPLTNFENNTFGLGHESGKSGSNHILEPNSRI